MLKLGGHLCRFSRIFVTVGVEEAILGVMGLRFMLTMFKTFTVFVRCGRHFAGLRDMRLKEEEYLKIPEFTLEHVNVGKFRIFIIQK